MIKQILQQSHSQYRFQWCRISFRRSDRYNFSCSDTDDEIDIKLQVMILSQSNNLVVMVFYNMTVDAKDLQFHTI